VGKFVVNMGPDLKRPGVVEQVAINLLGERPWVTVGGVAFRYRYGQVAENPDWGAWRLTFHSTVFCLVVLSKEEHGRARAQSEMIP